MDVEQRARELLAVVLHEMYPDDAGKRYVIDKLLVDELDLVSARGAIRAIIAALTPQEDHVVVTRNEAGQAVAVTRQDNEGRILSVIAEFEPPEGYVLVDAKLLGAVRVARLAILQKQAEAEQMDEPHDASMWAECAADLDAIAPRGMLAARPEVKND